MDKSKDVAIIVPAIKVEPLLLRCVTVCLETLPSAEVIVVLDTADNRRQLPERVNVLISGKATIAAKRNMGVRETNRKYLAFIDSDAYPSGDWPMAAISILEENPEVGIVGGPDLPPPDQSASERYVGLALRSPLVSGSSYFRKKISPARNCEHLPSCNMIVRREDFLMLGGMKEALFTGEDMAFCGDMVAARKAIRYSPDVVVYHKSRAMGPFFWQRLTYGANAIDSFLSSPKLKNAYVVMPTAFATFVASAIFIPVYPLWGGVILAGLFLALLATAVEALRVAERMTDLPYVFCCIWIDVIALALGSVLRIAGLQDRYRARYTNFDQRFLVKRTLRKPCVRF